MKEKMDLVTEIKADLKPTITSMTQTSIRQASQALTAHMSQIEQKLITIFEDLKIQFSEKVLDSISKAEKRSDDLEQ
jgi:hypothetical protein